MNVDKAPRVVFALAAAAVTAALFQTVSQLGDDRAAAMAKLDAEAARLALARPAPKASASLQVAQSQTAAAR